MPLQGVSGILSCNGKCLFYDKIITKHEKQEQYDVGI